MSKEIENLMKLEGIETFEEATLIYNKRKTLPINAFCGPSCSYPCHNGSCVRESFDKVNKEKPEDWQKIVKCIKERAERFGIVLTGFSEAKDRSKLIEWYLDKINSE